MTKSKISEICCTRCFKAKSPKEKCKCKCEGAHHSEGRTINKDTGQKDLVSCAQKGENK